MASTDPRGPYRGLDPYEERDVAFFFGRERETALVVDNLMASRFTVLFGPSGVGKSSMLRAGVMRTLWERARQLEVAPPEFVPVYFSEWRDDPARGLISAVERATASAPADAPGLAVALERLAESAGELFLILDQFEEFFLYQPDAAGDVFASELADVLRRPQVPLSVALSIREDSLAALDRFSGQIPGVFDGALRIRPLDRQAGRAAIERPLEHHNIAHPESRLEIEAALVDAVLDQVETGRIAFGGGAAVVQRQQNWIDAPSLQLVMWRIWAEEQAAGSTVLRLATLERLGGAAAIVRTHVEAALYELSLSERDGAATILHHLITPGGAKLALSVADLAAYTDLKRETIETVVGRLSEARLLRPIAPPADLPDAAIRYEIFHAVLALPLLDWRTRYLAERAAESRGRGLFSRRR
jgi:Novel STAND NTPase 1